MKFFKGVAVAGSVLLAIGMQAAHAEPGVPPAHVDVMDSCHKGLVVWMALGSHRKCGMVGTPQVKVFDGAGRLRFIGSALDAIQWAKAGLPSTPIPGNVVVRDAASEARITHAGAPSPGHGWVVYYLSTPCPPCQTQLPMLRSEVMPKLGVGTVFSVVELSE